MVKCPFCQFDNEDGALFCEQCKSDLGGATPMKVGGAEAPLAAVLAEPGANSIPLAAIAEAAPVMESPLALAEAIPVAPVSEGVFPAAVVEAHAAPDLTLSPAPPPVAEPVPVMADPMTAAVAEPVAAEPAAVSSDAKPKLVVIRGQRMNVEYQLFEGDNYIGRTDEQPVDVDLEEQEPPDRIWSSRQHAVIHIENGSMTIEDLNSLNGTFVNRMKIPGGQKKPLGVNDVIQIGTVQMRVKA